MDINDLILSDEALAVIDRGTWVDVGDEAPGVKLLVVGLQSKEAKDAMRYKQEKARKMNRGKPLTDAQHSAITKEVLYEVILKDWDGLKQNGEPLAYSPELAKQWIGSRAGEKFALLVLTAANRLDDMANEYVEEVSKN